MFVGVIVCLIHSQSTRRYETTIKFLGYPYLDLRDNFQHTTQAGDAMHPTKGTDEILRVILNVDTVGNLGE